MVATLFTYSALPVAPVAYAVASNESALQEPTPGRIGPTIPTAVSSTPDRPVRQTGGGVRLAGNGVRLAGRGARLAGGKVHLKRLVKKVKKPAKTISKTGIGLLSMYDPAAAQQADQVRTVVMSGGKKRPGEDLRSHAASAQSGSGYRRRHDRRKRRRHRR